MYLFTTDDIKGIKPRTLLYLLPYLILLLLGGWYRFHTSNIAILDGDSDTYLHSPYLKAITGYWYMDERPFQYLQFVYILLSHHYGLREIIIAQKILSIAGAGFLALAWIVFVNRSKGNTFLSHLLGYIMLGVYISTPLLMYYEQLIGPECVCIFVMCGLIYCLSVGFSGNMNPVITPVALSVAIFINLYLADPMPKFVFVAAFLEAILIYVIARAPGLSLHRKLLLIISPHILYLFVVSIPEFTHKTIRPFQSRVYIEFEQMAYTHFDLLAQDKSNFGLSPALQDSLLQYFHESGEGQSNTLTGFSNDYLMFGKASGAIDNYYHYNYDSIERFYKREDFKLVTQYPLSLARQICRQITAFYIPNKFIHKDLFSASVDVAGTKEMAKHFDGHLIESLSVDTQITRRTQFSKGAVINPDFFLSPRYANLNVNGGLGSYEQLPLLFRNTFWLYRWFDEIFLATMILFFISRLLQHKIFSMNIISIFYVLIFIYVITISIVHTFDTCRFVGTIYPFLLITTFMAFSYIIQAASLLSLNQKNSFGKTHNLQ